MFKSLVYIFGHPLRFTFFVIVMLLITLVVTQIIIPLIMNQALFPWFSKKPKIASKIALTNEEINEELMAQQLEVQRAELAKLKAQQERAKSSTDYSDYTPPKAKNFKTPSNTRQYRSPRSYMTNDK